jgi:cell division protein FtsB
MRIQNIAKRVFFCAEVALFAYIYICGAHGLRALYALEQENNVLQNQIETLTVEIKDISNTITQWDMHPFYKEKIAREQLQMAGKNEDIYYIS